MNRKIFLLTFLLFLSTLSINTPIIAKNSSHLSQAEALKLATEAYIYGYPLVTMDLTRQVMTNVATPKDGKAPMGSFGNMQKYPDASFHDVTAPNADTLYSVAWLDLSKEPYVLQIPKEDHRYYLMPMLSGWTTVFGAPGTRTTGNKAQEWVIIGPHWNGLIPKRTRAIRSPTNMVWILGRTYSTGTPEDYQTVAKIQAGYKLIPLSSYGKRYTPPTGTVDPNIDMKTPVRNQVNAMDANTFFKKLASLMKSNPSTHADAPMVAKLAKLGIVAGKNFDINQLNQNTAKALNQAVKAGQTKIMSLDSTGLVKNGWSFTTRTGTYGTDYLQRAYITAIGLGANLPQDAIYPKATIDDTGAKLNGTNKYLIHFEKGKLPPVRGFWSLTLYNDQYFFVSNPLNRYSISARNHLIQNPDGSTDIYIQHVSPGKEKESNWLPAPTGDFALMFRFYWPDNQIVKGLWIPPGVKKVGGAGV
jgi:hypothetical protein